MDNLKIEYNWFGSPKSLREDFYQTKNIDGQSIFLKEFLLKFGCKIFECEFPKYTLIFDTEEQKTYFQIRYL